VALSHLLAGEVADVAWWNQTPFRQKAVREGEKKTGNWAGASATIIIDVFYCIASDSSPKPCQAAEGDSPIFAVNRENRDSPL